MSSPLTHCRPLLEVIFKGVDRDYATATSKKMKLTADSYRLLCDPFARNRAMSVGDERESSRNFDN